jgi:hypothetical protein
MPDDTHDHPLTVCEKVPQWVHDPMTEMGYQLIPCSWANALYEWHVSTVEETPIHTIEMFFFNEGQQVRLLASVKGDTYENAFCREADTDLLHSKVATLRQRLRAAHV